MGEEWNEALTTFIQRGSLKKTFAFVKSAYAKETVSFF